MSKTTPVSFQEDFLSLQNTNSIFENQILINLKNLFFWFWNFEYISTFHAIRDGTSSLFWWIIYVILFVVILLFLRRILKERWLNWRYGKK